MTPKVLEIVATKTGYPQDMLDLELDLEADLGIDTVKQAETFAAIRAAFDIPVQESLSLRDYPDAAKRRRLRLSVPARPRPNGAETRRQSPAKLLRAEAARGATASAEARRRR